MFYLRYIREELIRRMGKTITVTFGLAVAGAIIIVIISISNSLSSAQRTVLNPLENVGTDIMITRTVNVENIRSLDESTRAEMMKENQVGTDLSKLGNPGDQFSNDSFTTGSMLTFASADTSKIDPSLVAQYSPSLILNVLHQEGTIPKVTATFETGGQMIGFSRTFEMSDADRQAFVDAQQQAMADMKAKGIDPNSAAGREYLRANLPRPTQEISGQVEVPKETITQDVGPITTDIQTENYTVGGVDTSKTSIGLILPGQLVEGQWFAGENDVILNRTFAESKQKKVGDLFKLGNTDFAIVGIVEPKLFTTTADIYLPLAALQKIAGRDGQINTLLLKATNAKNVTLAGESTAALFTDAKVTDAAETAKQVSGSLVSAANLTNRFIGLTTIIVIVACLAIVSLLTVSSVNKRVREIGTLKAIGWGNGLVVRQIVLENIVLGLLGAVVGIGLGLVGLYLVNRFNVSLSATIASSNVGQSIMRRFLGGAESTADITTTVQLKLALSWIVLAMGAGVALLGSVVAATFAAMKASRMKPQEALRNIE